MADRWEESGVPRGAAYDQRFEKLAASGMDMHGEAALVASYGPTTILDAGCGTGRVAIELDRLGFEVMGIDLDDGMLAAARAKAPDLTWLRGDLADPDLDIEPQTFDLVVMAGNVLIFVTPGTEGDVMDNAARWLRPGGLLVSGYSIRPGGFDPGSHDALAARAGLVLVDRWSTWDRQPYTPAADYAVAVHRREASPPTAG